MNAYYAKSVVEKKIDELNLNNSVSVRLICSGLVLQVIVNNICFDALPEELAEMIKNIETSDDFLNLLKNGEFPKYNIPMVKNLNKNKNPEIKNNLRV